MLATTLSEAFPYTKHLFNVQNQATCPFMPKNPLLMRLGINFGGIVQTFHNSLYLSGWQPGWLTAPAFLLSSTLSGVPLPLASWEMVTFTAPPLTGRYIHVWPRLGNPAWLPSLPAAAKGLLLLAMGGRQPLFWAANSWLLSHGFVIWGAESATLCCWGWVDLAAAI